MLSSLRFNNTYKYPKDIQFIDILLTSIKDLEVTSNKLISRQ